MKIGFEAKRAFLNSSGLGNYSRNTIFGLKNFFPENEIALFSPKVNNKFLKNPDDFEIISPKPSASKLYKTYWRTFEFGRKLDRCQLDIFHGLSNELPWGIHKTEVPSVVTIHDLIFLRFPEFYKSIDRKIYLRKVKYACRSAQKIIAISEQTKADVVKFLNVEPQKIEVVYQSISPVFFEENLAFDFRSKYNLPEKFILCVGTLESRKNQLLVLKAICSEKIKSAVVFVGKPTKYKTDLQNYIAEKKMESRVHFLENIPENELAALYRQAQLSVYISVFEGFGLPVIESMACGCPVITSNVSCLPETAGDAALLCSPSDINALGRGMKNMLEDNELRRELIKKGKGRARLFHPKRYSEKLISLYSEIIEETKCTTI